MRAIRVLVVDDSALIRQMLTRALSMDPRVEVVGIARTGVEAIERARELDPDVITLDIEMPELNGLEALPHIASRCSARIVMLSSVSDPDTTYRALQLGAVDFIPKPDAGMAGSITELSELLLKRIKVASRIKPERVAAASTEFVSAGRGRIDSDKGGTPSPGALAAIVGIAASTGGPPALERVMTELSADMPAAYLITQHLPAGFTASLARRLSNAGTVAVAEAADKTVVAPGHGYVAPHGTHLGLERIGGVLRLRLIDGAHMHGVRPAADPMFASMAEHAGDSAVAVILTGMGADGAKGALAIREAGGDVIVQDEETSVVWGMPGATVRAGAATSVVPISSVATTVRRAVRNRAGVRNG